MAAFNVYSKNNVLRITVHASDNSTHQIGIQDESVLSLSMTTQTCVRLEPNDYVDFLGSRFWLLEAYTPKQSSTVEWNYDLKFYGVESITKQALMLNSEGVPLEAYHAPAREQVAMIVMNLNRWMGNITDWKVGDCVVTENLDIDYSGGTYCNEALTKIAEAAGTEWWMEGMSINLTRAEHSEPIELAYGNGLLAIERDNADNVPFFTRLFPIGSSRNIEYGSYGSSRLRLPGGAKYVERNADKYGVVERYEEEAFSHIFPRRTGYISTVRSEQAKSDDGTTFTIYYFTDIGLNFNPNSYEIGGLVKHIIFQEGDLAGRDFEVNYNSSTKEFEIITQWPYDNDVQVPGGLLVPKPGNPYVLYNIKMPQEYYPIAEQEYAAAVADFLNEHSGMTDRSVYKSPTNYIVLDNRGITLSIGQRVRLLSDRFFPGIGYRNSRITRISRNVNRPNQADIEISDVLSKTSQSNMQDSIAAVRHEFKAATTTFPDIIRSWDNTLPTDNNIFSARRVLKESISKKNNDTASGLIRFLQGVETGNYEQGAHGSKITAQGNAEFEEAILRKGARSTDFVDGMTGEGFRIWMDAFGLANLTLDKLTVRQTMSVMELLINKVRSVGGQIVVSAGNGKIKTVQQTGSNYTITFETENTFVANDLVRCSTFTGNALKSYWVEVASADGNGIVVPVSEFAGQVPAAGDECVLMGNTKNPLRQNLISIAATEDGQPRIDVLNGVAQKNFNGCLRSRFGNLDGIQDDWFPLDNQPRGDGLYADNAFLRGTFLLVTGEDIKTKFEITEGLIQSSVDSVRQDFIEDKGYLNNAAFVEGMNKWDTLNEAVFFLANNKWLWINDKIYSHKSNYASVRKDGGRTTVFIKNKYIKQANVNLRSKPNFLVNSENLKEPVPVYLSFFYRVEKAGTLTVTFDDVNKAGFVNFNSFEAIKYLEPTDGYQQFIADGLWNGTGDFRVTFTGEIYLYMLVLSEDRVEALRYRYKTLFEQSNKLIKIAASNFDKDGNVLESSSIITTSKYNELISQRFNVDGSLKDVSGLVTTSGFAALFSQGMSANGVVVQSQISTFITANDAGELISNATIKANQIQLEGLVTVNQNFKVLADGSIEANNGTFTGVINAISGMIGGFEIASGRIGAAASHSGGGGNLAIYSDFFRVGGNNAYVMFGDDVIPSTAGGAFTAAGRIVNNLPNTGGLWGFDQANYGLFISVSGGTKNYGISSDAALKAPAFINTKAELLTFGTGNYSVDFSQRNIILMYYNQSDYSGVNVTLPNEASVARQFGVSTLPNDFATIVTFRVRAGSKNITLLGIYNHNESVVNYEMAPGDSVTVLISKTDGFRYQILNHSS